MNFLSLSNLVNNKRNSLHFLQEKGIMHKKRVCTQNHPMTLSLSDKQDRWRCRQGIYVYV